MTATCPLQEGGDLEKCKKAAKGGTQNILVFSCLAGWSAAGGVGTIFGGGCTPSTCHETWK